MILGHALYASELAFTWLWSLGEVGAAFLRFDELSPDPALDRIVEDIQRRGFYVDVPERPVLRGVDGDGIAPRTITGENPYVHIGKRRRPVHRVIAHLVPARAVRRARRLLVVHHCYGVPSPRAMAALFGLDDLAETDVAYSIMNHHQRSTYPLWPGTGMVSLSPACMLENLRAAITGARTLVRGLREARDYEHVSVLGYSIGGQLSLHIANTERVDRAILYCPVVSMERMSLELGLLPRLHPWITRLAQRRDPRYTAQVLRLADPLRHPLAIPQESIDVFAQRYDAMTPPHHLEAIRTKYPRVRWHEADGTHLVPIGRQRIRAIVAAHRP
ncbi:alpha/beta fold hydrolase [Pendulispora albinea]|uniref:Uncharacterized protein n=1 Tax=Pendulispora albinea TaxID=2741071 RepID=A0ABZ2M9Q1_9BACT